MTVLNVKLYVNREDNIVGNAEYKNGTVNGILIQEVNDIIPMKAKYYINTARPSVDALGVWRYGFEGRLKSFKLYYKENFEGVRVIAGNVNMAINDGAGKRVVACWIAAYDEKVIAFEVHFPNGKIHNTDAVELVFNKTVHETDFITTAEAKLDSKFIEVGIANVWSKMTAGSNLTVDDLKLIHAKIKAKMKQEDIAKGHNITQARVSQLKKKLKEEGLL